MGGSYHSVAYHAMALPVRVIHTIAFPVWTLGLHHTVACMGASYHSVACHTIALPVTPERCLYVYDTWQY